MNKKISTSFKIFSSILWVPVTLCISLEIITFSDWVYEYNWTRNQITQTTDIKIDQLNEVSDQIKSYFKDDQDNDITINDFDLRNTFDKKKEKILIKGKFAENKFKINFLNKKNNKKYLNFSIPNLGMKMKIIFDEKSNFNKTSGKLNLKILNNILSLKFNGLKTYNITESFFRNKFLNSKLDGSINFEKDFYFDLNSQINQIDIIGIQFA